MTPLAALLARIGWTTPELARRLGCSQARVHRWRLGLSTRGRPTEPPPDVLAWLTRVADAVEREGVPGR